MKKIVIITNISRDPEYLYTIAAETMLQEAGFITVRYTPSFSDDNESDVFMNARAILVLGGDGTILNASHLAANYHLPILAVNLGRLGYIAQLEKNDLEKIVPILSSNFSTEERAMLSVTLTRDQTVIYQNKTALNDAVISKLNGHGIIEFELYANEKLINYYRGDGLILATATGSTAYSMSAGGCIVDPSLRIIEATPIAAHSLKARPIVFSDSHVLKLVVLPSQNEACITLDGETVTPLRPYDKIEVSLSENVTKLVSSDHGFCHILYQKMSDL